MTLEVLRRIRCNVYGSINLTPLEDKVVSHPYFQRLRRIRQTAFLSYVFPGATHTRLEHSLGAMHLAGRAWRRLGENQSRLRSLCEANEPFIEKENKYLRDDVPGKLSPVIYDMSDVFSSDELLQVIRLAALLHDVGHPPYSHSGERFLPSWKKLLESNSKAPQYIKDYILSMHEKSKQEGEVRSNHEIYTILLIHEILADVYEENPDLSFMISPRDLSAIIIPEIELGENSKLLRNGTHHLCHELVSGEVDIDRMDYMQRDARECGVAYGLFDVDRILDSLAVYFNPDDNLPHLALHYKGFAAFEDYLKARQSMFVQLYFHKTGVSCEAMMNLIVQKIPDFSLPSDPREYVKVDEYNFHTLLDQAGQNTIEDKEQKEVFSEALLNLFLHRRLWKVVYQYEELLGRGSHDNSEEITEVKKLLKSLAIPFEIIISKNKITKVGPRLPGQKSRTFLRLIKLDSHDFPRVEAIEDHFSFKDQAPIVIHRIYTSSKNAEKARREIRSFFESHSL